MAKDETLDRSPLSFPEPRLAELPRALDPGLPVVVRPPPRRAPLLWERIAREAHLCHGLAMQMAFNQAPPQGVERELDEAEIDCEIDEGDLHDHLFGLCDNGFTLAGAIHNPRTPWILQKWFEADADAYFAQVELAKKLFVRWAERHGKWIAA